MSQPASESVWPTLFWTLGLALVFSSLVHDENGFILGGLIGYLIAQRLQLGRRLNTLEQRLLNLESKPAAKKAAERLPVAPPVRPAPTEIVETRPVATTPSVSVSPPASPIHSPWAKPAATPAPATPSSAERWMQEGLAWLKRGNPLARVGVVILFFGGVFLAKYAADHALLPLELRLAALAAGALVLLVLGWRLRVRKPMYAQILQGGGVAGLYLTIFAATRLYHLLPHGLALQLLIAVAVAAALLAVAQSALPLAVIGFAGGFLAPVLLSTGGGNHVALFSYYTVLNLGVFTVAWFRAWRVLNLVGFICTFTITSTWRALSYKPENLVSADFFLLLFFLLYVAISILFALRQKPDLRGYVSGSLVFGLPVVVFTLHATLVSRQEFAMAWSALGFGAFYLTLAWTLFVSKRPSFALLAEAFAALGVVFASLAVPLAFDRQTTAAMWAVEGAGLVWIGLRQQRRLARAFGLLLQLLAGLGYLGGLANLKSGLPVLNSAWIGTLLLAVSGLLTGLWLFRKRTQLANYEMQLDSVIGLWGAAWWVYGGLAELDRSAPKTMDYGGALGFAALTLFAGHILGRHWNWPLLTRTVAVLLPLSLFTALLAATDPDHPFGDFGYLGWPLLLLAAFWLLYRLDQHLDETLGSLLPWLHATLFWSLALLVGWELHWQIAQTVSGVWRDLPWGLAPASLLWLVSREPLTPHWPLGRHGASYRTLGAAPLAVVAVIWVLLINLGSAGDPAWLPYLPLLNPLDLAVALVLLSLAHYVLTLTPDQRLQLWPTDRRILWGLAAGLVFLWLNAALIRALHYTVDTPLDLSGIRHSFLVQASLSIFWSLLGLAAMTIASRRAQRPVWIAGAALMGAVVVKLFLIDLSGTGTLARIASFLTVGALLLLAGYLSPLPPSAAQKETPA